MNTCIYDALERGVCVCMCVHDNLKTIPDMCFLRGSYVDCKKSSLLVRITDQGEWLRSSLSLPRWRCW